MPVPVTSSIPKEQAFVPIPPDVYECVISDIDEEIKPSPFKKKDGTPEDDSHQFKLKLSIVDSTFENSFVTCWVRASLQASTKAKRPTLPQFLLAVTGQQFGPDDREKVNGEFLNSLIGAPLRVATQIEKGKQNPDKEFAVVTSFLPSKKGQA
jgi:hypothetical protein